MTPANARFTQLWVVALHSISTFCLGLCTLGTGCRWGPDGNGSSIGCWPQCLHSGPLFHTTDRRSVPLAWQRALGEWIPQQSHGLRWVKWDASPRKNRCLYGNLFPVWWVAQRSLSSSPHLLDLVDFRTHEASRGGHLLESVGEVMGPLMVEVRVSASWNTLA